MNRARWLPTGLTGLVCFGLAIGAQFVTATYGEGGPQPPPVRVAEAPAADRARLRLVGDALPVLHLSGTPYEMGRQHGALLKPQIHFLIKEYGEALVIRAVGRKALEEWAAAVEEHIPAPYREELRGLADGAGLTYKEALLVNTMVDRFQSMFCSTLVAGADATRDGEIYFGRNLDFAGRRILHKMTVVFVFEPAGGTPVVSIGWPGIIGVLSGMNAHGVAGATMMIHRGEPARPGMPYLIMYREALARARKTADIAAYIRGVKRTCPNNFTVVDKTGASLVVEFNQDKVVTRPADRGCVCSTNYFHSAEMGEAQHFQVGHSRFDDLADYLAEERGRIDLVGVKGALADVARPWFMNVQAMVFLPARRAVHVSVGGKLPAARQPYVLLDEKFLFGDSGVSR